MKKLGIITIAIILLAIGFIVGIFFNQSKKATTPELIITPIVTKLAPGESIVTFPEPIEGTPESNPRLTVIAKIRDAATGEPVIASRVILGGEVIAEDVSEFKFTLPGEVLDYVFLEVQAPGYEEWKIGFRHRLRHSRTYTAYGSPQIIFLCSLLFSPNTRH